MQCVQEYTSWPFKHKNPHLSCHLVQAFTVAGEGFYLKNIESLRLLGTSNWHLWGVQKLTAAERGKSCLPFLRLLTLSVVEARVYAS